MADDLPAEPRPPRPPRPPADVEVSLSVHAHADGRRVVVRRCVRVDADGTARTLHIDAVVG